MSTLPRLVSIDVIRDELEIYTRAALARIDVLAEQSVRQTLLEVSREVSSCTSVAEARELFDDQEGAGDYGEDADRILRRCDETFRAGVHANELMEQIERELKQFAADLLRVLSYRSRRLP